MAGSSAVGNAGVAVRALDFPPGISLSARFVLLPPYCAGARGCLPPLGERSSSQLKEAPWTRSPVPEQLVK